MGTQYGDRLGIYEDASKGEAHAPLQSVKMCLSWSFDVPKVGQSAWHH